jgi:threonine dehydrogenase-like Zn-dependent dehydrogenase
MRPLPKRSPLCDELGYDWADEGHEFGGTIVAVRRDNARFKMGDRVAVKNARRMPGMRILLFWKSSRLQQACRQQAGLLSVCGM